MLHNNHLTTCFLIRKPLICNTIALNFSIEFLEEADEFISKLEDKSRAKVLYNLKKSQYVLDSNLFKKLNKNI